MAIISVADVYPGAQGKFGLPAAQPSIAPSNAQAASGARALVPQRTPALWWAGLVAALVLVRILWEVAE